MRLFGRNRGLFDQPPFAGDIIVPGASFLVFARQTLGNSFGPSCRIRRIVHQHLLPEVYQAKSILVEYDILDAYGSKREVACRFLDQYGSLLAEANLEVDLLS